MKRAGGKIEHRLHRGRPDARIEQRCAMGYQGDSVAFLFVGPLVGPVRRQEISRNKMLRGEHAVHCFNGEVAPAAKEVGQMRLSKTGLPSKQRNAERAALYPS